MSSWKNLSLFAMAGLALFAMAFSACGDDDDGGAEGAANGDAAAKAQVIGAVSVIRGEALHVFDDEVNAASEIDAGWAGKVTRVRQVTKGTEWPADLQVLADALISESEAMEAALEAEDLPTVKEHAVGVHETSHELESAAFPWYAGEEAEGHGAEEEEGGEESGEENDEGDEESPTS